jgi:Transglutaminase-like superfamily
LISPGSVRPTGSPGGAPAAVLDFYRRHGPITDPGDRARLLDGLPSDVASLVAVVKGVTLHEQAGRRLYGLTEVQEVSADDSRFMADLLSTIVKIDGAPLTVPRPPALRISGDCRNPPLLLVTMLRQQGVPARKRTGYARFIPSAVPLGMPHDLTEYWDETRRRWVLVDPGVDDEVAARRAAWFAQRGEGWKGECDVLDVGRNLFVLGPDIWLGFRSGRILPEQLSVYGDHLGRAVQVLLEDLDSLNKTELHGHDLDFERPARESPEFLDDVAELAAGVDERFEEMRRCFDDSLWGRTARERLAAFTA